MDIRTLHFHYFSSATHKLSGIFNEITAATLIKDLKNQELIFHVRALDLKNETVSENN